jgi:hypothetical protein
LVERKIDYTDRNMLIVTDDPADAVQIMIDHHYRNEIAAEEPGTMRVAWGLEPDKRPVKNDQTDRQEPKTGEPE